MKEILPFHKTNATDCVDESDTIRSRVHIQSIIGDVQFANKRSGNILNFHRMLSTSPFTFPFLRFDTEEIKFTDGICGLQCKYTQSITRKRHRNGKCRNMGVARILSGEHFSKIFKKFLKKIAKMHYFSI